MKTKVIKFIKVNKSFLLFIFLTVVFRSAVADWNEVPSGSMQPTIVEGDRILVNKIAYDVRVPFTHVSLFKRADPVRGDIIIFDSAVSERRLVKRVAGVPGDHVAMINNVLYINGNRLSYENLSSTFAGEDRLENLLGVEHMVRVSATGSKLSSFDEIVVPDDFYLALGDSRDDSADSRVIGFVPRAEIIGRTRSVVLSLNYDNFYMPRSERFFHTFLN